MAVGAPDGAEHAFTDAGDVVGRPARDRRQQPHEAGEVVDATAPGLRVGDVLGIRNRIAQPHAGLVDADGHLRREEVVGDAHLVAIGIGPEGQQRGVLGLPPEAADALGAGRAIGDERGPSADAVAPARLRVGQRQQGGVVDRLDQAGAEERNRHSADDDVGLDGNRRLTGVTWHREQVEQGFALGGDRRERAVLQPTAGSDFGDRTHPAYRRDVVARGAAGAVERRSEALFGGFDLEEVVESQPELLEFSAG